MKPEIEYQLPPLPADLRANPSWAVYETNRLQEEKKAELAQRQDDLVEGSWCFYTGDHRIVLGPAPEPIVRPPAAMRRKLRQQKEERDQQEIQAQKGKNKKPGGRWLKNLSEKEKLFGMFATGFISCAMIIGLFSWSFVSNMEPIDLTDEELYAESMLESVTTNDIERAHEQLLESMGSQESTPRKTQILWSGAPGYLTGFYVAAREGVVRDAPLLDGNELDHYEAGASAQVSAIETGLNDTVWGKVSEDAWILLDQTGQIQTFGPGQYETLSDLEVLNAVGKATSTIRSGNSFIVQEINLFGKDIYGIMEDGSMVLMNADTLRRSA